jgi:RHS repeat-associated protein
MYQPELGRFLQPDPNEFAAGDYNLYRYCHNGIGGFACTWI